jgi:iron(II)-dependent oxidoreductase
MTAPARSFPLGASREGLLNLVGNVWEWTRDFYAPYGGEAPPEIAGKYRVLRGGAWNSDLTRLSTTHRLAYDPDFRFAANGGFRCVRAPD